VRPEEPATPMRYEHTVVFRLRGIGYTEHADLELTNHQERAIRAWITVDADGPCADADRSGALGTMLLHTMVGGGPSGTFEERLAAESQEVKQRRRERSASGPYLVFQHRGELANWDPAAEREFDQLVIRINGPPKEAITAASASAVSALVSALALQFGQKVSVEEVCRSIVFLRDDGKPVYSFTGEASGNIVAVTSLPRESVAQVAEWLEALLNASEFERVIRLHFSSLEAGSDTLRSFLAAWSALEIFVSKVFTAYEDQLFDDLERQSEAEAYRSYLRRIVEVMKDKYRLADKFSVVAVRLAPDDADDDLTIFRRAKKLRDDLAHGQDVDEDALPASAVRSLLLKYLSLHLEERIPLKRNGA
jgi:hypothetical protein